MGALAEFVSNPALATFVNDHDWTWPLCEILHFVGMALLIGTVGLLDLRILGVGKGIPVSALEKLVPIGIAAFSINAITGYVFVAGNPVGGPADYLANLAFQIKMLLILLAGINLSIYYFAGIAREAMAAGPAADAPRKAKLIAGASLFFWIGVIIFGRLLMYNDTLLYALGL